jgi:endo-1,4-beta-xylanase
MTATCLRVPACTGMTFWGLTDGDRYTDLIRSNRGAQTMFDATGKAKPAYDGAVMALEKAPGPRNRLSGGGPAG